MGWGIRELASIAAQQPEVAGILNQESAGTVLSRLRAVPQAATFLEALDAFLIEHGHRTLKEFELSVPRWSEDPRPVLAMVRNYLQADCGPPPQSQRGEEQREALLDSVESRLLTLPAERWGRWRTRVLRRAINRVKHFAKLRENSRYYHITIWQVVRQKILQLEQRLLAGNKLKCKGDIFFLRVDELQAMAGGAVNWNDVEQAVRERRLDHVRECQQVPPRTIGLNEPERQPDATSDRLRGNGAAPGVCQGRARVILDPGANAEIKPGEILVAPYTDPAWTPLFLTARAAVVEIGSYLSHAGTIAREYGMPCVVDVAGCTRRIATGDLLSVDGNSGEVSVLERAG